MIISGAPVEYDGAYLYLACVHDAHLEGVAAVGKLRFGTVVGAHPEGRHYTTTQRGIGRIKITILCIIDNRIFYNAAFGCQRDANSKKGNYYL